MEIGAMRLRCRRRRAVGRGGRREEEEEEARADEHVTCRS